MVVKDKNEVGGPPVWGDIWYELGIAPYHRVVGFQSSGSKTPEPLQLRPYARNGDRI